MLIRPFFSLVCFAPDDGAAGGVSPSSSPVSAGGEQAGGDSGIDSSPAPGERTADDRSMLAQVEAHLAAEDSEPDTPDDDPFGIAEPEPVAPAPVEPPKPAAPVAPVLNAQQQQIVKQLGLPPALSSPEAVDALATVIPQLLERHAQQLAAKQTPAQPAQQPAKPPEPFDPLAGINLDEYGPELVQAIRAPYQKMAERLQAIEAANAQQQQVFQQQERARQEQLAQQQNQLRSQEFDQVLGTLPGKEVYMNNLPLAQQVYREAYALHQAGIPWEDAVKRTHYGTNHEAILQSKMQTVSKLTQDRRAQAVASPTLKPGVEGQSDTEFLQSIVAIGEKHGMNMRMPASV